MQTLQRTRRVPGPLPLLLLVSVLIGSTVRAHDPGLSSLDVNVTDGMVSMALSVAAADVAVIASTGDARLALRELAGDAIRLSADDEALRSTVRDVSMQAAEARVKLSFALPPANHVRRLAIASDVPERIGRGHRQLLVVTVDNRVMAETLLESNSGPVMVELDPKSFSMVRLLFVMVMAMAGAGSLIELWRRAPAPTDPL
jgi:hypothetical protein